MFAGRFYPYLDPSLYRRRQRPTIASASQLKPFRIPPFFDDLCEQPECVSIGRCAQSTFLRGKLPAVARGSIPVAALTVIHVINFDSRKFDFNDPLWDAGIRYLLEQRTIDVMKWTIFKNTKAA